MTVFRRKGRRYLIRPALRTLSKLPKINLTVVLGLCVGCNNPKSILLSCFNGTCSEKCAKSVARRNERQAEKAALAAVQAKAEAAKQEAEVTEWAARLRGEYEKMGRLFASLPSNPREARATLLTREKFILAQKASEATRERKLRGR